MPFPSKLKLYISIIVVIIFVALVQLPGLFNGFVGWGDEIYLLNNAVISHLDIEHLSRIVTTSLNGLYTPLTNLLFAIEHFVFQYNPFVYHTNNLLLHLVNVVLVYLLSHQLGVGYIGSSIAALVFGIHPMHVEPVAWVSGRKDLLATFFFFLAMLFYIKYMIFAKRGKKRLELFFSANAFSVLSVLSSPWGATLPVIFILLDWYEGRRFDRSVFFEKLPLSIVLIFILFISLLGPGQIVNYSIVDIIWIFFYRISFYLWHFFIPGKTIPLYPIVTPIEGTQAVYLLSFLGGMLLLILAWWQRRNKDFIFALLFYAATMFYLTHALDAFVRQGLVLVGDRFMYLPSFGICFLLGKSLENIWLTRNPRRKNLNKCLIACVGAVFVVYGYNSIKNISAWKNGQVFWQYQLERNPRSFIALNSLAGLLRMHPEYIKAQEVYRKYLKISGENIKDEFVGKDVLAKVQQIAGLYGRAITIGPQYKESYFNLGDYYIDLGKYPEAIVSLRKALEVDPKFLKAILGLGNAYRLSGLNKQAKETFGRAINLFPNDEEMLFSIALFYQDSLRSEDIPEFKTEQKEVTQKLARLAKMNSNEVSYYNLGYLWSEMGDVGKAEEAYKEAIKLNPLYSNALYNLGNLYKDQGKNEAALEMYQRSIGVDPQRSEAFLNLGVVHSRTGNLSQATNDFKSALEIDPRDPRPHFNLAFISESLGNLTDAIESYREVVALDSDNAEAYYNMGNAYAKLNQDREAISAYQKAVSVNPKHLNAWVNLSIISFQEKDYKNAVKYFDQALLLGYVPEEGYVNSLKPFRY